MNIDTWAVVVATALGLFFAVVITLWREERRSIYNRRLSAFRILMSTRRVGISPEHVGALNLVEVDFYNVKNVERAWEDYKKHLNSDPRQSQNWHEEKERLLAALLFQMSKKLKFDIPALEIFKGGYAPQGWQYREERQDASLDFLYEIAKGKKRIPVDVFQEKH